MAQGLSRRPLTMEDRDRPHVRFVVDKVVLEQVFLRVLQFPPMPHTHLHLYVAFTRKNGRSPAIFQ